MRAQQVAPGEFASLKGALEDIRMALQRSEEAKQASEVPGELKNLNRVPRYASTLRSMNDLYERYHDCRGAQCQVAVPTRFQLTPIESRRLTQHQIRATNQYYGN